MINTITVMVIIIGIHEAGHFIVAGLLGRPITSYEIGIGPQLHGYRNRRGIWFRFCLLPLGGCVRLAFRSRHRWKNMCVYAAGPIANFILAGAMWSLWHHIALISLLCGVINLIPFTGSDGWGLIKEWKHKYS